MSIRHLRASTNLGGLACIAAALALLVVLKALPYSSVRLTPVEAFEATRPPTPDFTIGPLTWPVRELAQAPALRPFREAFRATCGDSRGLAAAACASTALAARSPIGSPSSEFVNVDFDPVVHFERHMAGEPGHCLTRSAIVATQLLSVGIPARVVQLVPARAKGHTLVGVWDETRGWIVVDPTADGFVTGAERHGSATDLLGDPARIEWTPFGSEPVSATESETKKRQFQALLTGDVLYPEPWLYLRQGKRVAPWPFRGQYARVGPTFLTLGPAQQALVWAIPGLLATGFGLLAAGWRRRQAPAGVHALRGLDAMSPAWRSGGNTDPVRD